MHDPVIEEITETRYLVEYTGAYRAADGGSVDIPLIAVINYDGTQIKSIREYWDTHRLASMATATH